MMLDFAPGVTSTVPGGTVHIYVYARECVCIPVSFTARCIFGVVGYQNFHWFPWHSIMVYFPTSYLISFSVWSAVYRWLTMGKIRISIGWRWTPLQRFGVCVWFIFLISDICIWLTLSYTTQKLQTWVKNSSIFTQDHKSVNCLIKLRLYC